MRAWGLLVCCWSAAALGQAGGDAKARPRPGAGFVAQTHRSTAGELNYRWMTPEKVVPGMRYPLVLCLHGSGGNSWAAGVLETPALREKFPCFVMAPQGAKGDGWALFPGFERGAKRKELLPRVVEAIRARLAQDPIDADRIYVTGQSLGGVGTWGALARHGDLFAAGVPVCGAWDVKDAPAIAMRPVWAFHGTKDEAVPVRHSREMCAAVEKAGGVAKFTEYADLAHGSWSRAYAEPELWPWLFRQRKPAP